MSFDFVMKNVKSYNAEMRKPLLDKAFFLDKIDADIIVDFGCADGALIEFIRHIDPKKVCIGYDIAETELEIAQLRLPDVAFFSDWELLIEYVNSIRKENRVAVICNSLIHEVYAYGNSTSVEEFWGRIYNSGFDTVVIRDMMPSKTINRPADIMSIAKVHRKAKEAMITEFESEWGSITDNKNLVHFLLKYRYEENWAREVKENYLPLYLETMIKDIPSKYKLTHFEHFVLGFIRKIVSEDFGIDLVDNTHVKIILDLK